MTDGQHTEVHEISERLNRVLAWFKWGAGGAGALGVAFLFLWIEMEGRVASLESYRDSTSETLRRIDRNVDELSRYLRDSARK